MAADSAILSEIIAAYDNDSNEWADIHEEGNLDVRVVGGDVWNALDPKGAKQRRDNNRPMITADEIGQYINQVINDLRANPRGVNFTESGKGASKPGAQFYQNKMREIEYRSHATLAYTTAFENAVQRGYGYVRVRTQYAEEGLDAANADTTDADPSFLNQDLWIDGVADPDMILPDPYALRPDISDMKRCFELEWRTVRDFKRDFPDAKVQSFTSSVRANAKNWFTKDGKQVLTAAYWTKERTKDTKTLLVLKPPPPSQDNPQPQPIAVWKEDLHTQPSSDLIISSRKVPIFQVKQRFTNGVEILRTTDWPGKYIPIAGCFGKTLFVDEGDGAKKKIMSMVRLAREPFLLYCYVRTCQAEVVGGVPKFPYFYYEGQLSRASIEALAKSLHVPVAGIPVRPTVEGAPPGQVLPPPTRNPYDGSGVQYLEILAEASRRAIQAAMGITPLPAPAQQENQKSGKALQQIESSGQRGSFHFADSFDSMIRHIGVICEDLMDKTYDTARDVAVRVPDAKGAYQPAIVRINDPANPESIFTKGDYQVTVSAGPSSESQRQAADDLVTSMVENIGQVAQVAGPQAAKELLSESVRIKIQGPSGDQLAEIINPPLPPNGGPSPQQVQELTQQNQQLQQAAQKMQQVIQGDQIKYTAQFKIESMKADKDAMLQLTLKKMDIAAKIEAARITAAKQSADLTAEAQEEAIALGLAHAHDANMTNLQNAHEVGMAAIDASHQAQASAQDHSQALEQGQQAAALAPPPADTGQPSA